MTTWDDKPNDYEHAVAILAEARAVIRDLLSSYHERHWKRVAKEYYAENEYLRRLLHEARQYVADASSDEDSETQRNSAALLAEIDRILKLAE